MRLLSNLGGALVIAADYRLAPEHVYPAAHDDAFTAAAIAREHALSWGGDPDNITIAGDSAGGHLALVTCLRLKNKGSGCRSGKFSFIPCWTPKAEAIAIKNMAMII